MRVNNLGLKWRGDPREAAVLLQGHVSQRLSHNILEVSRDESDSNSVCQHFGLIRGRNRPTLTVRN